MLCLHNLQAKPMAFEDACSRASKAEQIHELSQSFERSNQARLTQASRFPTLRFITNRSLPGVRILLMSQRLGSPRIWIFCGKEVKESNLPR